MASITLYPPVLDSTSDAFIDNNKCRIYYSLSKFSSAASSSIKSIHVSVIRQSSGITAVNKTNSDNRYRAAGIIIINTPPIPAGKDNLYYVDILPEDIAGGWTSGAIYKIQIRLSSVTYNGTDGMESWLNTNASYFSEWSTYCTTKAISLPQISIVPFSYTNSNTALNNEAIHYNISTSTLNFTGTYSNKDTSENLYSYRLRLYNLDDELIEDSSVIYSGQYEYFNKFNYVFKREFKNNERWKIILEYNTTNNYSEEIVFNFKITYASSSNNIKILSADDFAGIGNHIHSESGISNFPSTVAKDNEEGRIALKLYSTEKPENETKFFGNIYVRRASSRDNFLVWEDINIIPIEYPGMKISELDAFYDNTIESGVWYKYGVQIIRQAEGVRSILNEMPKPIIREFEYSFLVGEQGQQLKLPFNTELNSYAYTLMENKVDSIGGKYPIISRNAKLKYRTFPLTSLVSLHMDDMRLFLSEEEIFNSLEVAELYKTKRIADGVFYNDTIQEREFREKVLTFLQDGKPKLFKSPTEGNIIVRLINVTESPDKTLGRMIGSFSCTAYEISEASVENYRKYNFIETITPLGKFVTSSILFGQCVIEGVDKNTNIIEEILDKYNYEEAPINNKKLKLKEIKDLKIEIEGNPISIGDMLGYKITTDSGVLQVLNPVYSFGEEISFNKTSTINIEGNGTLDIIATFVYEQTNEEWVDRELLSLSYINNLGQIYKTIKSTDITSLYEMIVLKHNYDWGNTSTEVESLSWGVIECDPGTALLIKDSYDATGDEIIMNGTGRLDLSDLGNIYDIKIKFQAGETEKVIMINYTYTAKQGTYKEEE